MLRVILVLALALAMPQQGFADGEDRGPVTNLPLPRFVSIKGAEARMRRGPALTHRIDWIYRQSGTPLRVTAEYLAWRRVEDAEGASGWMHSILLSGVRTVVVVNDGLTLREAPQDGAPEVAIAQKGVVARLLACQPLWCEVRADGHTGWVVKTGIWGTDPDEEF